MDAKELQLRTRRFALCCIKLAESLPNTRAGRILADQLIRCSTSAASNYRASCRARSRREFLAKLGIVEEEQDESLFWVELIVDVGMKKAKLVQELLGEGDELLKIVVASIKSTRLNSASIRSPKSTIRN